MKILWLAPTFNHYKARFLDYFASENEIELTILSGTGRGKDQGDLEVDKSWKFRHILVPVSKKEFGSSSIVRSHLKAIFRDFDWILIPAEKKNIPLLIFALALRFKNKNIVKLFSYNHPLFKSGNGNSTLVDTILTRLFYSYLDRVVFYTHKSQIKAIENKYIKAPKAFWANNTIDTLEVQKHYSFEYPPLDDLRILFIGRLIPSKKTEVLLDYYNSLKSILKKEGKSLKLEIIGDGPDAVLVKKAQIEDADILWHGSLVDEKLISPIMKRASIIFLPGLSGLSINHSFSYGRPFITIKSDGHGPEINYLKDGINGYILTGEKDKDMEVFKHLFGNRFGLEKLSLGARETGSQLSVTNWVYQMKSALLHE